MKATRDGILTNYEVSELLISQQRARDEAEKQILLPGARRANANGTTAWMSQRAATNLSEQVLAYLDKAGLSGQTRDDIVAFQQGVKNFKLTRAECIALVNAPPISLVEIHLLVEDTDNRLSHSAQRELLMLCGQLLVRRQLDEEEPQLAPGFGEAQAEDGEEEAEGEAGAGVASEPMACAPRQDWYESRRVALPEIGL